MQVLPRLFKLSPWVDLDRFYAKVKFGDIGLCIGNSEFYLFIFFFFWKLLQPYVSKLLKHSLKWGIEVEWVSKVKVILWSWPKVTQISKLKLVFHRNGWAIWKQSSFESLRENGNENIWNELGHMTHMATIHIYGKNLKKSPSLEAIDRWPWNLVCSIVYASTTKVTNYDPGLTLTYFTSRSN